MRNASAGYAVGGTGVVRTEGNIFERRRRLGVQALGAIALLGAALFIAGCGKAPGAPTPVPNIIINNQNSNTNTNGGNAGSGQGGTGSGQAIGSVKVTQFGELCPPDSGKTTTGLSRTVRVGCVAYLTCTPFLKDGTKALPVDHGPVPDQFDMIAGQGCVVEHPAEAFNLDVKGSAVGKCTFRCVAKGVASGPPDFDLDVVN